MNEEWINTCDPLLECEKFTLGLGASIDDVIIARQIRLTYDGFDQNGTRAILRKQLTIMIPGSNDKLDLLSNFFAYPRTDLSQELLSKGEFFLFSTVGNISCDKDCAAVSLSGDREASGRNF